LFSYAFKDYLSNSSSRTEIENFYKALESTDDAFLLQVSSRDSGKLPRFEKEEVTHVGYKEVRYHHILPNMLRRATDVKFVLIQRNPFSVINSWLNAPREFRSDLGWSRLEEWRYALKKNLNRPEEYNGYEKWKEASLLFHYLAKQYPDRVLLLRYDALLDNPIEMSQSSFEFLNLEYTEQTENYLTQNKKSDDDAYSVVRSGQTDERWKVELEPGIIDAIRVDIAGTVLEPLVSED
jgi:hypothetical protein